MKDVMKLYEMKNAKNFPDNFMECSLKIAFEEITKRFIEQTDEAIVNYLYEKYKDTDVSRVFVLSKPDFKDFLEKMLPKYMKGR